MNLSILVGGTQGTFTRAMAEEVADLLDHAFGAEIDWEGTPPQRYGETLSSGWADFQQRATETLGSSEIPNILAFGPSGSGVYLPTSVRTVSLPLSAGGPLCCASLTGLRRELANLAEAWDLPLDDEGLSELLTPYVDPDDGPVADAPEILIYALLSLAANEATRRGCPLWMVGLQGEG
jgi:hypothetical protein